jgi:signal transduction histidine kinase
MKVTLAKHGGWTAGMRLAPLVVDAAALPLQKSGFSGGPKMPDFSRPVDPDKTERALRYAHLVIGCKPFAVAGSFGASVKKAEEEIKRIAYAVHDEAGQLLVAVHLALAEVARELPERQKQQVGRIEELLNQVETQLRRYSHELRPTILDDLGWLPAIRFLAEGVSKRANLNIQIKTTVAGRLPGPIEIALYRIVQEALTNVARHAGVAEVTVRAWADATAVTVQVIDAGAGFDPDGALHSGTTGGVTGMRERTLLLGGQLTIESASGNGTRLSAELPLPGRIDGGEHAYHHPASR